MELKLKHIASRKRRSTRSIDEKVTKKTRIESELMPPEAFETRINEIIKRAVEISHDVDDQLTDPSERVAYLKIMRKLCLKNYWNNRIISNRNEIKILLQKKTVTKDDCSKVQVSSNEWIKDKLEKLTGNTKGRKTESISNFYKNYIQSLGVKLDAIESKIDEYSVSNCSNTSTHSSSSSSSSRYQSFDDEEDIIQSRASCGCRLCGSTDSRLVINIYKAINNTTFKHLIEFYCCVKLEDEEHLSQLICVDCKSSIESFVKFCDKIEKHQNNFGQRAVSLNFKKEPVDLSVISQTIVRDLSTSSTLTLTNNSSKSPPLFIQSVQSLTNEQLNHSIERVDVIFDEHLEERNCNNTLNIMEDDRQNESSDEDENLPPIVRENIETLLSRCKKDVKIRINRLPIEFVPSDDESDDIPLKQALKLKENSVTKNKRTLNNNLDLNSKKMAMDYANKITDHAIET